MRACCSIAPRCGRSIRLVERVAMVETAGSVDLLDNRILWDVARKHRDPRSVNAAARPVRARPAGRASQPVVLAACGHDSRHFVLCRRKHGQRAARDGAAQGLGRAPRGDAQRAAISPPGGRAAANRAGAVSRRAAARLVDLGRGRKRCTAGGRAPGSAGRVERRRSAAASRTTSPCGSSSRLVWRPPAYWCWPTRSIRAGTSRWKPTASRVKLPIVRTNRVLRGVALPAGNHRLVYRYRPASVWLGGAISLASAATLVVAAAIGSAAGASLARAQI